MSTTEPLTLRLPSWLCESFDLSRAIANERRGCRFDQFDMRSHERAFVKAVLGRRSNLWLFRTNQRKSCGDFVVVDMSSPRPALRTAYVVELKLGARPRVGGGPVGVQLARAGEALAALPCRAPDGPVVVLTGDGAALAAGFTRRSR